MFEHRLRKSSRGGHTLPELLIILVILVAFAVMALPRFAGSMMQSRLDGALSQLKQDLSFARTRAVATGIRHQVLLDAETRELIVLPLSLIHI